MNENPYDREDEKDLKIWCPKQLCKWAGWLTPVSISPFAIFNWLKLKQFKEAFLSLIWILPGIALLLSPPANSWIFIICIIAYYELWKTFSCKRQLSYSENQLYACYTPFSIYPVIASGAFVIFSFFYYLNNSVGSPGFPNRALVEKFSEGKAKMFFSLNFEDKHKANFIAWIKEFNKNNQTNGQYVHLRKVNSMIQERIIFKESAIQNTALHKSMAVLAIKHSKELFSGVPVELHLCNTDFQTVKLITPGEDDLKHYFIQNDIEKILKLIRVDLQAGNEKIKDSLSNLKNSSIDDMMKFIDDLAAHMKKTLTVCQAYEFKSQEIKEFHSELTKLLTYRLDTYAGVFTDLINKKPINEATETIKSVDEKFSKFNKDLTDFTKSYFENFNK